MAHYTTFKVEDEFNKYEFFLHCKDKISVLLYLTNALMSKSWLDEFLSRYRKIEYIYSLCIIDLM